MEIIQALQVLTIRECQIVAMRYGLDGTGTEKSYQEIATALNIAVGTVRKTLENAKARVRTHFKGCCED